MTRARTTTMIISVGFQLAFVSRMFRGAGMAVGQSHGCSDSLAKLMSIMAVLAVWPNHVCNGYAGSLAEIMSVMSAQKRD